MENKTIKCSFKSTAIMRNSNDYHMFVIAMLDAARDGKLPYRAEHTKPMSITMNDIKVFSEQFKRDTELYIDFQQYTCSNCDRLHFYITIDYPPEYYFNNEEE